MAAEEPEAGTAEDERNAPTPEQRRAGEPAAATRAGTLASGALTAEPSDGPEQNTPETREYAPGRFGQPGRPLRRSPFLIGFTGGLGVLLAYATFLAVRGAASMLILIFIALFLAIGLNPAVARLRKWGLAHGLAVTVVALTVLLVLAGGIFALVPPVVTQTGQFLEQVPTYVEELRRNATVNELVERYDLMDRIQAAANPETIGQAVGGVFGGAQFIFGAIFNVLTVLVLTIYFMSAFDRLKTLGYSLVPASRRQRVSLITDEILAKVGAYMVGALAIAVLAGLCTFVFAMIVGLAYPFALAVVVAVCDLVPQIGATLGAVIVSLVGFATDLPAGIACLVFFVIYQQLENYLIYPKVMERSVKVNDVAAIVAALVGVALFGVIGALVAIPAMAAIQLILREVVLPRQQTR
ncbi:AI-2E family transporter [Micromonospora sp. NPDC050417]|uniref:AI-2E family transporter n=1 Tax=Micromonospora sp. NPDC050417 TaxID=3364280 RepID=UPI0037BB4F67